MSEIKVLIADDHRLFRLGLRQALEDAPGFTVAGEAENGEAAVRMAAERGPEVVLMDINMPLMDGVAATRRIMADTPACRVVILTMYRNDRYVFEAVKAGARGYLLKDIDERDLVEKIRAVHRGEVMINPAMATLLLDEFRRLSIAPEAERPPVERLTEGEMKVLRLVAKGMENREIARDLNISQRTVTNRLSEIYQKLSVNNRTQAALEALRRGWASLDDAG